MGTFYAGGGFVDGHTPQNKYECVNCGIKTGQVSFPECYGKDGIWRVAHTYKAIVSDKHDCPSCGREINSEDAECDDCRLQL